MDRHRLTILHTSDWHIGRTLYGRSRFAEFEAFLDWLAATIEREGVDVLLVAGDVFDTSAPGNRAQQLYYRFLCRVADSVCRHVVVIAGNHDSPSFLTAPRELLRALNIHVVGTVGDRLEEEVLVLATEEGVPEAIVCAVPYLRDRMIRSVEAGESVADKERKLVEGIREHYRVVVDRAETIRADLGLPIPIIGMGHLFTAGGQTIDGDGVRELYVGSLAHVPAGIFPEVLDYLALGHLHIPQLVGGCQARRYSGSPLPMGFGEARQNKSVCLVRFTPAESLQPPLISTIAIPGFQRLERVTGGWQTIAGTIEELAAAGTQAWLEVVYDGEELIGGLRERLDEMVAGTDLEILRIKNSRLFTRVLEQNTSEERLDDLDVHQVFTRCLEINEVPGEQWESLRHAYREAVISLLEDDSERDEREM
ncbi:Exodeoxyribonuclease I subunit D [Desulfofustis glycolicus DSM 9705]|uniref:Nuclease SbcCD subunit D n=1 Tax=Desulfofustis glycolicus DSM 9705 TaxID=1121409 RepID=A0A1M5YBB2_9BACT|nr:exonuclease SbcCD subunit D C-terminal domain-containing protein [Desulfofustis glycolicus]SHI09370.1 Exodeoxyribonuclease I subunit D [Desulfofustis glycolicus DSM 9705]